MTINNPPMPTTPVAQAIQLLALNEPQGQQFCNNATFYPRPDQLFACFDICPNPRVVIFGQDPYPRATSANGVAFWDAAKLMFGDVGRPTSIDVIAKAIVRDLGHAEQVNLLGGCKDFFERTAADGVLWLNTSLTFDPTGTVPKAQHIKFWKPILARIITDILPPNAVYVMIGKDAQKIKVPPTAVQIWLEHPSPLNRGFQFAAFTIATQIDAELARRGSAPIRWLAQAAQPTQPNPIVK